MLRRIIIINPDFFAVNMEREVAEVRKMLDLRLIELIQSVDALRRAVEALDPRRLF